jgi:hypothetical protein
MQLSKRSFMRRLHAVSFKEEQGKPQVEESQTVVPAGMPSRASSVRFGDSLPQFDVAKVPLEFMAASLRKVSNGLQCWRCTQVIESAPH